VRLQTKKEGNDFSEAHAQEDETTMGADFSDDHEHFNDVNEKEADGDNENSDDDDVGYDENEETADEHVPEDSDNMENGQEKIEQTYIPEQSTRIIAYADAAKAAISGDIALLREFLAVTQALIDQVDHNGWGLLHEAARMGQTEMVALLLRQGADPRQRTNTGQDALDLARLGGRASPELIDMIFLHQQRHQQHHTPKKHMDCEVGMDGLCRQESSESDKAPEQEAKTVDDEGDDHGDEDESVSIFDFWRAVVEGDASRVAAYVEEYPDFLDEVDSDNGWSGLHLAARGNHIEIVRLLLEEGADPSIKSHSAGQTALDIATQYFGIESPVTQLLAEYQ
jgi:hypothetical protein